MKSLRLILLALLVLPLAACYQGNGGWDESASMANYIDIKMGDQPTLSLDTADGEKITEQSLRGKVVVIDLWARWCGPCMDAAPDLVKLHQQFGPRGVSFIGVNFDEDEATMKSTAARIKFTWPQVFAGPGMEGALARKWRVQAIPITIVLSPEGRVVAITHPNGLEAALEKATARRAK